MEYRKRIAEDKVLELSNVFPVVLVTGARQCGKTTMLTHLSQGNRTYVSLDSIRDRILAQDDPELFFQKYNTPIFIDEVQYAPELFSYIKTIVDRNKVPGEFWLSGSQDFMIMRGVSESLAGRMGIVRMHPMIYEEAIGETKNLLSDYSFDSLKSRQGSKLEINSAFEYVFRGGMPAVLGMNDDMRSEYFDAYVGTYLMKDVVEFGRVSDAVKFQRFLSVAASQNTHAVNYATLASGAGISEPTAKEWLCLLEGMGVVWLLRPYYSNLLKRMIKSPKMYFYDTGLCAHICRMPSKDVLQNSAFAGEYFENLVVNLLKIKSDLISNSPGIFYYRDVDRNEIDVVLEEFDGLRPLEIKLSANPDKNVVKRFPLLEKSGRDVKPGGIICLASEPSPLDAHNSIIPMGLI